MSRCSGNTKIQTLTLISWYSIPTFGPSIPQNNDTIVPHEFLPMYGQSSKYYEAKHPCRTLTWLWNYSKKLQTNYLDRKYILATSSYQMIVSLQYNNYTLSLDELAMATAISKETLVQVLQRLVTAKVLIDNKTGLNLGKSQIRSFPWHLFTACADFKSKRVLVNLNHPTKAEVKGRIIRSPQGDLQRSQVHTPSDHRPVRSCYFRWVDVLVACHPAS